MCRRIYKTDDHANFNHQKIEAELSKLYKDSVIDSDGNVKSHFISPNNVIDVISNKGVAMWQNFLLEKYLSSPDQNLTLDCDKLTFNVQLSERDYQRLCENIEVVKTTAKKKLLNIKQRPPSEDEKLKGRFLCSRVFILFASTNPSNKVFIYLCVDKDKNRALHVAFTPRLFEVVELKAIFHHLMTTLGKTRYLQVISNARLSRVDIGFNLPNVSKACLVVMPKHNRCSVSNHYPNRDEHSYLFTASDDRVSESYYCGSQKGSHLLTYDRYLRILNKPRGNFKIMTRVEYRHKLHADAEHLTVKKLSEVKPKLHLYWFVSPWVFKVIPAAVTELMITNQGLSRILRAWSTAKQELLDRGNKLCGNTCKRKGRLSLRKKWLAKEQHALLALYQHIILNPKVTTAELRKFRENSH